MDSLRIVVARHILMFYQMLSCHAVEAISLSKQLRREREREHFNRFQVIEGIDPKIIDVFLFPV